MARFDYKLPDDLIKQFGRLGQVEHVAKKMIDESLPILRKAFQTTVEREFSSKGREVTYVKYEGSFGVKYGSYKQTGALRKSLRISKAKTMRNGGFYGYVHFAGKDEDGVSNALKAITIEYGKKGQAARPFIERIVRYAEPEILDKMQEVFNREVGIK